MRSSNLFCTQEPDGKLFNFYPNWKVIRICFGTARPIVPVRVTELAAPQPGCLWALWVNKDQSFRHVYAAQFLVEMCAPDGFRSAIERGEAVLCPVSVEITGDLVP